MLNNENEGVLEQLESYFKHPGVSQSLLKKIDNHPRDRKDPQKLYYEEKDYFLKGGLVDRLVFFTKDIIDQFYYIDALENKPTAAIMSILHEIYDNDLPLNEETVLEYARKQNYQPNWLDDTLVKKILTNENKVYYESLLSAKNRTIISKSEYENAVQLAHNINLNSYFNKWMYSDEYEVYVQQPIYIPFTEINNVTIELKGLPDVFFINKDTRELIIVDLKTTSDYLSSFKRNIYQYDYVYQLSFYGYLIKEWLKSNDITFRDVSYYILAASFKEPEYPELFEISNKDIDIKMYGSTHKTHSVVFNRNYSELTIERSNEIRGWIQSLNEYSWYLENGFEYKREYVENNFINKLDLY